MRLILISAVLLVGVALAVVFIVLPAKNEVSLVPPEPTASLSSPAPDILPEPEEEPPATAEILNTKIQTGETLIVELSEKPNKILFDGKEISSFPYQESFRALIPFALGTKTGIHNLSAEFTTSPTIQKTIAILAKVQQIIVFPPPPELGMTDKQIVQNLSVSNTDLRKIVAEVEEITRFDKPFNLPVGEEFVISSPFGEIRKTGEEEIVHLGVDFDVPKGTAIHAINDGTVKNAYLDSIYGNSVIVDHGRGIYSLYLHLNSMSVESGDAIEKGETLGFAGSSGLSSAPHLHLSVKINGVSIDPIQFIETFK
ncbi:MAG: M23 family metallopeptidase [Candidatus Jorgensenbacteria bacterium]